MKRLVPLVLFSLACTAGAVAQRDSANPGARELPGGARVAGTVTAVNGDTLTVKTLEGDQYQVMTGPNTRVTHERDPGKLADVKPGYGVMAFGQPDAASPQTVRAVFIAYETSAEVHERAATFGKTWIAGRVKSVNGTRLTLSTMTPGQTGEQEQVIQVDENTSFKRGRDSITLADIHAGDMVMGQGQVKDGFFTPTTLQARTPGERRQHPGGPPATGANGGAQQPPQDKQLPPPPPTPKM